MIHGGGRREGVEANVHLMDPHNLVSLGHEAKPVLNFKRPFDSWDHSAAQNSTVIESKGVSA
jgi:hypothetical protein